MGTGKIRLKRNAVFAVIACAVCLCLAIMPMKAFGEVQTNDIKVLSYSWYTSASSGDFIVVGELQNTGSNNYTYVSLSSTVYSSNGTALASLQGSAFASYFLPQQIAPFYLDFSPDSSITGDLSWVPSDIGHVDIQALGEEVTNSYQYSDLKIIDNASYIDPTTGLFTVTGILRNTGSENTGQVWVQAIFYNATGAVVEVGVSNYVTPTILTPEETTSFTVFPFDASAIQNQITNYTLVVQTQAPILPGGPAPTLSPSPSPTPPLTQSLSPTSNPSTLTSPSQQPTKSPQPEVGVFIPIIWLYGIVVSVIIIIAVVVAAKVFRKAPTIT